MTSIGFVGAGRMGEPMVQRLLAAGHPVTVLARRPEVRERLAGEGAVVVGDAAAAAADADVLLCCLFSDAQLAEVGPEIVAALPAGSVLASHVTGSLALLERLTALGAPRDVAVVDAPVSGNAESIRDGRLTVLLGGPPAAVDTVAAAVAAYADPVLRTGALGTALSLKLVNNLLFAAHVQTAAAAVRLAGELGIAEDALTAALAHTSGGSTALRYIAAAGDVERFGAGVAEFMRKDVAACEAAAAERGVAPGFLFDVARTGPLPLTATPSSAPA